WKPTSSISRRNGRSCKRCRRSENRSWRARESPLCSDGQWFEVNLTFVARSSLNNSWMLQEISPSLLFKEGFKDHGKKFPLGKGTKRLTPVEFFKPNFPERILAELPQ